MPLKKGKRKKREKNKAFILGEDQNEAGSVFQLVHVREKVADIRAGTPAHGGGKQAKQVGRGSWCHQAHAMVSGSVAEGA
jgi:hypothetical protein